MTSNEWRVSKQVRKQSYNSFIDNKIDYIKKYSSHESRCFSNNFRSCHWLLNDGEYWKFLPTHIFFFKFLTLHTKEPLNVHGDKISGQILTNTTYILNILPKRPKKQPQYCWPTSIDIPVQSQQKRQKKLKLL